MNVHNFHDAVVVNERTPGSPYDWLNQPIDLGIPSSNFWSKKLKITVNFPLSVVLNYSGRQPVVSGVKRYLAFSVNLVLRADTFDFSMLSNVCT